MFQTEKHDFRVYKRASVDRLFELYENESKVCEAAAALCCQPFKVPLGFTMMLRLDCLLDVKAVAGH